MQMQLFQFYTLNLNYKGILNIPQYQSFDKMKSDYIPKYFF